MTNMPDTAFIILYILYKIGCASLLISLLLFLATFLILISNIQCSETFNLKVTLCIGPAMLFCLAVGALTPSEKDIKVYAVYTICKTTSNTKEAQELIDTVIHYIEDKSTEK